ncbi:MAG: enoyl-CoA hydratase/isomerase family protein [Hydrogenophaga sp.]|uniref:enoyl-CoA hydratase/isomerase family protein n=1 Tax=Hydrogenophaga sp. TaxID=1904254 RepID=UPI001DD51157|nr:enoyl-CoA hydratase-related protein [Hydrogenophaga sp.]MBX3610287.1 enoyl-CoA hydratase/isomerase family protein [Hydrogenophaga sp.]
MNDQVVLQIDGAVARLRFVNPGKFNAMSRRMWRELAQHMQTIAHSPALRVVVLSGEGGHFCAGGDIGEYPDFRFDEAALRDFHENDVWGGLGALLACELPVIACIEGHCMGAGVEMASCCDLRVAGASARFGAPIARLGFPMAPREAELVVREAGLATAREMLLQAAVLDAPTLLARGFLNAVLPDAAVAADAEDRARRVAALSPLAARLNKRTVRALSHGQRAADLLADAYSYAEHPEHQEGINAFLGKRTPVF